VLTMHGVCRQVQRLYPPNSIPLLFSIALLCLYIDLEVHFAAEEGGWQNHQSLSCRHCCLVDQMSFEIVIQWDSDSDSEYYEDECDWEEEALYQGLVRQAARRQLHELLMLDELERAEAAAARAAAQAQAQARARAEAEAEVARLNWLAEERSVKQNSVSSNAQQQRQQQ
jgi:hypothetical protein